MQRKTISSFAAAYIVIGLLGVIILLYSIGREVYKVTTQNLIFTEKEAELEKLKVQIEELEKTFSIRSTPEYKQRFRKENFDIYENGEIVLILPPEEKTNEFVGLTPEQIQAEIDKKKPIINQWKDVFFKKDE